VVGLVKVCLPKRTHQPIVFTPTEVPLLHYALKGRT
jgi:hypothetical protein